MNQEETLTLWDKGKGKEAWNQWAEQMSARRSSLESQNLWRFKRKDEFELATPANAETSRWVEDACAIFSSRDNPSTFDDDFSFVGFEFPGDVIFDSAVFRGNVSFSEVTFCGTAYFTYAKFHGREANFTQAHFCEDSSGLAIHCSTKKHISQTLTLKKKHHSISANSKIKLRLILLQPANHLA